MNVPERIGIDVAARRLSLTWSAGQTQHIDNATLRERCPCSLCRRLSLTGALVRPDKDIAIVDVQAMGYGVQLVFSDGHDRGVYPWAYLAALP
ncbi:DUF971 domain-containing protein [Paraburkholderia lacunae]|uniref:DUF971 domain-containing protein n=1 Tax=Paraburkholderia lacunae TaxID=2211104 RepID=A0A370N0X2_9BURK|nr:DUF971 domain-containing protein [Paraburkholderia lacunae]RDJ99259.1 DUF971 domain-containing protein [Paraburkholderia lacunae]